MLYLKNQIKTIEDLLKENTIQSLTYAALECRLAIEIICYERWKIAYDYLPYADLQKWQPRNVIKQVVSDVNEKASKEFTLAFAPHKPDKKKPETVEDFEALDFVEIGKQSEININKLGKLWNALSNVALHVSLPKSKEEELSLHGDSEKIIAKIKDTLSELKKISEGNLIMGGAGGSGLVYKFNCETCNSEIRKSYDSLNKIQVVNCISPNCMESYIVEKDGDNLKHTRYKQDLECKKCKTINCVPHNYLTRFRYGQTLTVTCYECKYNNELILKPLIKNLTEDTAKNNS